LPGNGLIKFVTVCSLNLLGAAKGVQISKVHV
jgi:hypothetical protein